MVKKEVKESIWRKCEYGAPALKAHDTICRMLFYIDGVYWQITAIGGTIRLLSI